GNDGDVELDLDDVELEVDGSGGPFRLEARGGKAEITALGSGGEIRLEETPATLSGCQGDLDIESDAEIALRNNKASIHVMGYGASLRGFAHEGLLEIVTRAADVILENVQGPVRVQGDGLHVSMQEIGGEVYVATTSSNINLRRMRAAVTVDNDYGDVTMGEVDGKIAVTNRDGNVVLEELKTEVEVEADGDDVRVSWASLDSNAGPSTIRNAGGGVSVVLPPNGGCTLRATSRFGRIESELADVIVSDDGSSAEGSVNRRSRPVVVVESEGPVQLATGN
ncbi:MAG: DUF4097 family beta strand repeat-containing protein, partial [Acidobacteriota bacterium]|nr:DUF4097 family beta strand repeat-containing protein [Acidobacteriota bacterium]